MTDAERTTPPPAATRRGRAGRGAGAGGRAARRLERADPDHRPGAHRRGAGLRAPTPGQAGPGRAGDRRLPRRRAGVSPAIAGVAAAVETVHTYSLVHDDLPCMDDDDLRRGRPTTHRAVRRAHGHPGRVPAGAGRGAGAGAGRARRWSLAAGTLGRMAGELFEAGGIEGMVGGPVARPRGRGPDARPRRSCIAVHRGKTGALIRAACVLGGTRGRGAGADGRRRCGGYGQEIGLAFQIADDVLDVTGTSDQLGKTAGRDAALAKSTYVQLARGGAGPRGGGGRRRRARRSGTWSAPGCRSDALAALAQLYCDSRIADSNPGPGCRHGSARHHPRPRRPQAASPGTSCPSWPRRSASGSSTAAP